MKRTNRLFSTIKKHYFRNFLSPAIFGALTVVAIAVALQQFYIINLHSATRYSLWWHIPFNLFYFWYWFLAFPLMYWITVGFKVGRSRIIYWTSIYLLFPILLVLVHQVIASLVINLSLGYLDVPTLVYKRILRNPWLGLDIIIYFAIMISIDVIEYRQKDREDTLKLTKLQGQLVQSQLNALESQLHPHFLFNTLNTISTLILKRENAEAGRMLLLLSDFLRTTVYGSERHVITFEEELRFINQYLEIEKVRFSDRLVVLRDVDDNALKAGVPNLLLQPIVENAIRYAVAPQKGGGTISISAHRSNGRLSIIVRDNGPGLKTKNARNVKEGVGLGVTRERLERLFGEDHVLQLSNEPGGGLAVNIEIPFVGNEVSAYHGA